MSNEKCDHCGARWGMGDNQWVSVKDRMPQEDQLVLKCREADGMGNGYSLGYLKKDDTEYWQYWKPVSFTTRIKND